MACPNGTHMPMPPIWTPTSYIWSMGPISILVFDLEVVKWHLNHSEYLILS